MWPLLAAIGPRILIPGFFLGPKLFSMTDPVQISQTIALSILFMSFATTLFTDNYWLALIPGIAAWAYWNMLRDEANLEFYRYTDWSLTTPLILLAILSTNHASILTMVSIVILDLTMIATGYFGAKETKETTKMGLFLIGCLLFLPILYTLFSMKKTKYAIALTLIMWTLYPVVWYIDEEKMISTSAANITYSFMDVIAKVGLIYTLHI